jgi:peptide/nickel transport system ATP-binding protein
VKLPERELKREIKGNGPATNLLSVNNLHISFNTEAGVVRASGGIDLAVRQGKSLCLVGESGCGKTVLAMSIMRLLPENARVSGEIWFRGKDLSLAGEEEMRRIRGREIAMIFAQPATYLNPVITVGEQIAEAVRAHRHCSRREAREKTLELMEMVRIHPPRQRYDHYPHEFSGGMQQRAMIAMALAFSPRLLIADEPTSSLDVTVQAEILELLEDLVARFGSSLLLITHDLGVAAGMCDHAAVMYAAEIVETGDAGEVFGRPRHPYTKALLGAISDGELKPIKGSVPELTHLPDGCRFHPRCRFCLDICREKRPEMKEGVRCHLW